MPVLLILLGVAGLAFWESQKRSHGAPGSTQNQYYGLYQQAMATSDPVTLVTAAQTLMKAGYPDLARQLSARYQQLTNNPIPGVAGVGGLHSLVGARGLDPRTLQVLATAGRIRRQRNAQRQQALTRLLAQRITRTS